MSAAGAWRAGGGAPWLDAGAAEIARLRRAGEIAAALSDRLAGLGFDVVDPPVLGPADPLFALYGEEIWDRAFIVEDVDAGQLCLRPDFTAPAARAHLAGSAGVPRPARLRYAGPVFRRTPIGGDAGQARAQHLQVGAEIIGAPDGGDGAARDAQSDAEAYRLCADALAAAGCPDFDVVVGDLGVVFALLDALDLPEAWRGRLRRHIWRPDRFRALIQRFTGGRDGDVSGDGAAQQGASGGRAAFLKALGGMDQAEAERAVREMIKLSDTPQIGVRGPGDVADRYLALAADARARPMPAETAALLQTALGVAAPLPEAADRLSALARGAGVDLDAALQRLSLRAAALEAAGAPVERIAFDADFGRNLAYYDGFVFEMTAPNPDRGGSAGPRLKLAGGGRYDRLFAALAAAEPALSAAAAGLNGVGLAVRPEAIAEVLDA